MNPKGKMRLRVGDHFYILLALIIWVQTAFADDLIYPITNPHVIAHHHLNPESKIEAENLLSLTPSEIAGLIDAYYPSHSSQQSQVLQDLKALPNSILARVILNSTSYNDGWAERLCIELFNQNPDRLAALAFSLKSETITGHEESYGYHGILLLHRLLRYNPEIERYETVVVDGVKIRKKLPPRDPTNEIISRIGFIDHHYARSLQIRHNFRIRNPGKADPLGLREITKLDREISIQKSLHEYPSKSPAKLPDPQAESLALKDGQVALWDFPSKGNVQISVRRGDALIVSIRDLDSRRTVLAALDTQMNMEMIYDQLLRLSINLGVSLENSALSILRSEYRHQNELIAYLIQRAKADGFADIELTHIEESIRSHDIRYFPRSNSFQRVDGTQNREDGFELSPSPHSESLEVVYDRRTQNADEQAGLDPNLKRLDKNKDGKISGNELQSATVDELLAFLDRPTDDDQLRTKIFELLKLDTVLLGATLMREFSNSEVQATFVQELLDTNSGKFLKMIERMQEHPFNEKNEANTHEGRNAFYILRHLTEAQRTKVFRMLEEKGIAAEYIANIRLQFEHLGEAEAVSSHRVDAYFQPREYIPIASRQSSLHAYEAKPGLIYVSNGNQNPSRLLVDFNPNNAMIVVLIESPGSKENIFAIFDSGTNTTQFVRELIQLMQKLRLDRTKANVRIYGDAEHFPGKMSSISRGFYDEKLASIINFNTSVPTTLSVGLVDASIEETEIDWKNIRSQRVLLSKPIGLKVIDPKLQSERDYDLEKLGRVSKARIISWVKNFCRSAMNRLRGPRSSSPD